MPPQAQVQLQASPLPFQLTVVSPVGLSLPSMVSDKARGGFNIRQAEWGPWEG